MIRAIVVDDEPIAMEFLCFHLMRTGLVEIVGRFISPTKALKEVNNGLVADVAFLDIDMPHMTGLELAAALLSALEQIEIVFVTAHNQFVIEAFELNAISYLMKPLEPGKLAPVLERVGRLLGKNSDTSITRRRKILEIKTFGHTAYSISGVEQSIAWTPKAEELLIYLLYNQTASKQQIIADLFADQEEDKAEKLLQLNIYYVKKELMNYGFASALAIADSEYKLSSAGIKLDSRNFIEAVALFAVINPDNVEQAVQAFYSYTGKFMADKHYPWAKKIQVALENQYRLFSKSIAEYFSATDDSRAAIDVGRRAEEITHL